MRDAIGPLESAEVDAALAVLEAAYGPVTAMGARTRMRAEPGVWLGIRADGTLAGVVTANRYGGAAYVAMMAISPDFRKRGLGTALITALVTELDREGHPIQMLDARQEAEGMYGRLGFHEVDRTVILERDAPAPRPTATGAIDAATLARIVALDARYCGCDRSEALRRFAREPYATAATSHGAYMMARGPLVGPFAADDLAVASELLEIALQRNPFASRALLPESNAGAASLYERHGFAATRTLAHMVRNGPTPFRRDCIYGQASLGHG